MQIAVSRAFSVISDASEEAGGTPALPAVPPAHYPAACAPPPLTHNRMTLLYLTCSHQADD